MACALIERIVQISSTWLSAQSAYTHATADMQVLRHENAHLRDSLRTGEGNLTNCWPVMIELLLRLTLLRETIWTLPMRAI